MTQNSFPLISQLPNGKLYLHKETFQLINEANSICICICGDYRTGKSFLLNALFEKQFAVSGSTQACTQGVRVWSQPIIHKDMRIWIVDSEGLGSCDRDSTYDGKIFLLTLLLSDVFIYNSLNSIDQHALDKLVQMCSLCPLLQNKVLYWVLRDFSLQLLHKDGTPVTADQYLQNCLKYTVLKNIFKVRKCFGLVRPLIDQKKLASLEQGQCRDQFIRQIIILREHIFDHLQSNKIVGGLEMWIDRLNQGGIKTNLNVMYQDIAREEKEKNKQKKMAFLQNKFNKINSSLPMKQKQIEELFKNIENKEDCQEIIEFIKINQKQIKQKNKIAIQTQIKQFINKKTEILQKQKSFKFLKIIEECKQKFSQMKNQINQILIDEQLNWSRKKIENMQNSIEAYKKLQKQNNKQRQKERKENKIQLQKLYLSIEELKKVHEHQNFLIQSEYEKKQLILHSENDKRLIMSKEQCKEQLKWEWEGKVRSQVEAQRKKYVSIIKEQTILLTQLKLQETQLLEDTAQKNQKIIQLRRELSQMEYKYKAELEKILSQQKQIIMKSINEKIDEDNQKYNIIQNHCSSLQIIIQQLNNKCVNYEKTLQQNVEQNKINLQNLNSKQLELSNKINIIQKLQQEIKNQKNILETDILKLRQRQNTINQLSSCLNESQARKRILVQEIEQLKKINNESRRLLTEGQTLYGMLEGQLQSQHKNQLQAINDKNKKLVGEVEYFKVQIQLQKQNHVHNINQLRQIIQDTYQMNQFTLQQALVRLCKQLKESKKSQFDIKETLIQNTNQLEQASQIISTLKKQKNQFQKQIFLLNQNISSLTLQHENIQDSRWNYQQKITNLQQKMNQHNFSNKALKQQLTLLQKQNNELKQQLQRIQSINEQQINRLLRQLHTQQQMAYRREEAIRDNTSLYKSSIDRLTHQNNSLNKSLKATAQQLTNEVRIAVEQRDGLIEQIRQLQMNLTRMTHLSKTKPKPQNQDLQQDLYRSKLQELADNKYQLLKDEFQQYKKKTRETISQLEKNKSNFINNKQSKQYKGVINIVQQKFKNQQYQRKLLLQKNKEFIQQIQNLKAQNKKLYEMTSTQSLKYTQILKSNKDRQNNSLINKNFQDRIMLKANYLLK